MSYRRLFLLVSTAVLFAGCTGANGGHTIPFPASTSSTASGKVGPGGGAVSTSLNGIAITVTAPAGALSATTTLTVTLQTSDSLTTTFAKARAAAATARTKQAISPGATPIVAFTVDIGGATLSQPLTVSFTGVAAPATGQSDLVSGYNASSFDDIATMTYASGTLGETGDAHYPGLTLASQTLYVLYTVATANITPPTAVVSIAGPAAVDTGAQGTFAATEATSNGFPFFDHTFTYGLTPGTLGTINATTGVFTGGAIGGPGSVTATDAAFPTFTGTEAVTVGSPRPGYAGFSQQFAGTLTETDANNAIDATPVSQVTSSNATVTVAATADPADTSGTTTGVTFTANESDASNLTTLTSTTTSTVLYQTLTGGATDVRLKKTVANESSGVIYEHDYTATNGLTTILPETAQTFTNDASETYLETDPGLGVTASGQGVTTNKVINPDGSYNATFNELDIVLGTPVADTATMNTDFSGVLNLNSIDPGAFLIQFGAPTAGTITFTTIDPNFELDNPATLPSYIPAGMTKPATETDTITPGVALDPACTNGATYATANQVAQSQSIVDSVFGTVETKTVTSYDVPSAGTVCTIVADTINTFYDYTGQEGPFLISYDGAASKPLLTTTISEALSLQPPPAGTSTGSSVARAKQSATTVATLPVEMLAAHVQHLARKRALQRLAVFRHNASLKYHRGGSVK